MSRNDNSRGRLVPTDPNSAAGRAKAEEAARTKERVSQQVTLMQGRMTDIEPWLRQSGISPDAFISSFRLAMARDPKIANCTPMSLLLACMDCARVGLPPDGKKAALVPFKNNDNNGALEATLIIMYQGHLDVIYRTGLISSAGCQVVYEGEDDPQYLRYSIGDDPFVEFNPPINRDDSKPIIAAFATAKAVDGIGKWVEVMGQKELEKVRAAGKAGDKSPGKHWPSEMARKAPLRRMMKFLPKHPDLDALATIEARAYKGLPDDYGKAKPRLSDADLLSDEPVKQLAEPELTPEGEEGDSVSDDRPEDADRDLAQAPLRFVAMLEHAVDADSLESRATMIHLDQIYQALDVAEKALIDMTLRSQREAFGLDPETGQPAAAE